MTRLDAGLVVVCLVFASQAVAQTPSFSGADGAGASATGGRGGVVYHVNLLDQNYSDHREGTLRYGLDDSNFTVDGTVQKRTIVFDVGGAFWLGRYGADQGHNNGWDTQSRLNLGSNITLAGQTAPGGVYIMGGVVKASGQNDIVRNVNIAPGYGLRNFAKPEDGIEPTPGDFPDSYVYDAIDISGQNLIFDHVTTVYGTDETVSADERADDITVQYSNISQGQNYPQADAEASGVRYTGHALGSLFQPGTDANLSIHHNLYAQQKGRLPRVGTEADELSDPDTGSYNDFRDNVFYNWYNTAGTGASGQPSQNNFIGNFFLAGPGGDDVTQLPGDDGVLGTTDDVAVVTSKDGGIRVFYGDNPQGTLVFHAGNVKDTNKDGDAEDSVALTDSDFSDSNIQDSAFTQTPYHGHTETAEEAYDRVLAYVGAFGNRAEIDEGIVNLDQRLVEEVRTGTGKIMAWADDPFNDDPDEGTEWRALLALRADTTTGAAPFARPADFDSDQDGMPDQWEVKYGLDPNTPDNNGDYDRDGYTNLEEYLNELVEIPAPTALIFSNTNGNGRYAEIGNWGDGVWQPSRYDEVRVNQGDVVVGVVGQYAGNLTLATNDGDAASLSVTDGWLAVTHRVQIGGDGATGVGALTLSGGRLSAAVISKNTASQFIFTGGTLEAGEIQFDLVNQGGVLSPGPSVGRTHVTGDVELVAGALKIQIDGEGDADLLVVDGILDLGGALEIDPLTPLDIQSTDRWLIAQAGLITGDFASVTDGFTYESDGQNLFITAVPEPASLMIFGGGLVGMLSRRRRRG